MSARFLGIMSGTSMDGIDLALIRVETEPFALALEVFDCVLFEEAIRGELLGLIQDSVCEHQKMIATETALGELYADAVAGFLSDNRIDPASIRALGMHGITSFHAPEPSEALGRMVAGTRQIGDPFVLAARTGLPVVHDFRRADMARGGQGAPLAPWLDRLLFSDPEHRRILVNLGGIANLTLLDPGNSRIVAFDSGPANMIIDSLMRGHPTCAAGYDPSGHHAAKGTVIPALLEHCLEHPYFRRTPPKTTGRELFGEAFTHRFTSFSPKAAINDLVATATELTVRTLVDAVHTVLDDGPRAGDAMIVSGGGALNDTMMNALEERLPLLSVSTTSDHGIPVEAKEAVLIAALTWAHLEGLPGNVPEITGARGEAVLGSLAPV